MDPDEECTCPDREVHLIRCHGLHCFDAKRVLFMEHYVMPSTKRRDIPEKIAKFVELNRRQRPKTTMYSRQIQYLRKLENHYKWLEGEREFALDHGAKIDWEIE